MKFIKSDAEQAFKPYTITMTVEDAQDDNALRGMIGHWIDSPILHERVLGVILRDMFSK